MSNIPAPSTLSPASHGRKWGFAVWGVVGILASGMVVWLAFQRTQPRTEQQEVTVHEPIYRTTKVLTEVETEEGKKVKAFVPKQVAEAREVKKKEEVTRVPTAEQRLRLYFLMGAGGLIGLFSLLVMVAWFSYFFRSGGNPPKVLEDWLKYLVSGILGAVLGFLGSPAGDSQVKVKPAESGQPQAGQSK